MAELELIPIGKLTKTHALKGALKMRPFNVETVFFDYTDTLYLKDGTEYKIKKVQLQKDIFIITFEGIDTIEKAQLLKGNEIFVDKADIPVEDDEILLFDMLGFEAVFDNKIVGKVIDFADYNAGFIYIVKDDDNNTYYLPDNDYFVEKTDYDEGKIYFKNIEELLN